MFAEAELAAGATRWLFIIACRRWDLGGIQVDPCRGRPVAHLWEAEFLLQWASAPARGPLPVGRGRELQAAGSSVRQWEAQGRDMVAGGLGLAVRATAAFSSVPLPATDGTLRLDGGVGALAADLPTHVPGLLL